MRSLFVLCLLVLFSSSLFAQKQGKEYVDSCIAALPLVTVDTVKIKLYGDISSNLSSINPEKGIIYGNEGLELADQFNFAIGKAKANVALGQNHQAKSDYAVALEHYLKAIRIYQGLNDTFSASKIDLNIAAVYEALKNLPKALEYDSIALRYFTRISNDKFKALALGNIGVLYDGQAKWDKALQYYMRANEINDRNGYRGEYAKNLGNIGGVYFNKKDYSKAIENASNAVKIYEQLGDKHSTALNYCNIGAFYLGIAQDTITKIKADALIPSGKNANLNLAIEFLNKSKVVAKEVGFMEALEQCDTSLSLIYYLKGDYKEALNYYRQYNVLVDSVNLASARVKVSDLEAKSIAESKDKDLKIAQLKKSRNSIIYISGIVILLIIIGIVGKNFLTEIKSNRQLAKERKKHIERIRAQKNALMDIAYVQSHEVRGPISTILGLAQLFNYDDLSDPNNKELMEGIATVTQRLDKVVTDVVKKENKLHSEGEKDAETDGEV